MIGKSCSLNSVPITFLIQYVQIVKNANSYSHNFLGDWTMLSCEKNNVYHYLMLRTSLLGYSHIDNIQIPTLGSKSSLLWPKEEKYILHDGTSFAHIVKMYNYIHVMYTFSICVMDASYINFMNFIHLMVINFIEPILKLAMHAYIIIQCSYYFPYNIILGPSMTSNISAI